MGLEAVCKILEEGIAAVLDGEVKYTFTPETPYDLTSPDKKYLSEQENPYVLIDIQAIRSEPLQNNEQYHYYFVIVLDCRYLKTTTSRKFLAFLDKVSKIANKKSLSAHFRAFEKQGGETTHGRWKSSLYVVNVDCIA